MSKLFTGLSALELVLMGMGVVIFLALVFLLVWSVMKSRPITSFLPFFLIPIIMVGYPSITAIRFSEGVLEINKIAQQVDEHPADTAAATALKAAVAQMTASDRLYQSSSALAAVAKAQAALGKYDSASLYLKKAAALDPGAEEVSAVSKDLQQKIRVRETFSRNIDILAGQLQTLDRSPGDTASVRRITHMLNDIEPPPYTLPEEAVVLAKSFAVTGNTQQSLQVVDKLGASAAVPDTAVNQLKDSIQDQVLQQRLNPRILHSSPVIRPAAVPKDLLERTVIRER